MNVNTKQQGFTLIELMISLLIIGVLASIALPAYKTYFARSKYAEVIQASTAAKAAMQICVQLTALPNCSTIAVQAGWSAAPQVNNIVLAGAAGGPYTITVTPVASNGIVVTDDYILTGTVPAGLNALSWVASGGCQASGVC